MVKSYTSSEIIAKLEGTGLPFAPIAKPEDMFDDPHLNASGGLEPVTLPDGNKTTLPLIPIEMNGHRLGVSSTIPQIGENTSSILVALGYDDAEIDAMFKTGVAG